MSTVQLVTLHGALLDGHMWDAMWDALDQATTLERTDLVLPGHSDDQEDISPVSTHEVSESLLPQLESLKPGPVVLCGHSWGAMVALDLAARYPDRVQGLIVMETSLGTSTTVGERLGTLFARGLLRLLSPATLSRLTAAEYGRHSPRTKAYLGSTTGRLGVEKIRSVMNAVFAFDIREALGAIQQPTLILVGERNRRTHAQARQLQEGLRQSTLVTIVDAGHLPMLDNPLQTASVVGDYVRKQFPNGP